MDRSALLSWVSMLVLGGCHALSPRMPDPNTQVCPRVAREAVDTPGSGRCSIVQTAGLRPQSDAAEPSTEAGPQAALPPLSLAESLSIGLAQNPDLIALRQSEFSGAAALGVAQTYPYNPFVQAQATPFQDRPQGGHGLTSHYVLLMQQIELAGQQRHREAAGTASLNSVRWNIHQAELQNVAQTLRLYFAALYQRRLRDLALQADENNRALLQTLEKQLAAGQASAADVAIVRSDARSTRQQAQLANTTHQSALRDLQRHLGLPPDDTLQLAGDLRKLRFQMPSDIPDGESPATDSRATVVGRAGNRPDVLAARAEVDAARAALGLATARKTPDLQIGPYYARTDDRTTYLGLRAQMDVPVVNSGRPLENQRCAELHQRITAARQIQRRAELEAQAALDRFRLAVESVTEAQTEDQSLPQALARLEVQFKAGEVEILRIFQARQSLLQSERTLLDLLNEAAQAAANLTAATGLPAESLVSE